jgi:hypothetical protein
MTIPRVTPFAGVGAATQQSLRNVRPTSVQGGMRGIAVESALEVSGEADLGVFPCEMA